MIVFYSLPLKTNTSIAYASAYASASIAYVSASFAYAYASIANASASIAYAYASIVYAYANASASIAYAYANASASIAYAYASIAYAYASLFNLVNCITAQMQPEKRLAQVISICDSTSSLVGRHAAIVSPKNGDHFVIIVGEGVFKSRLGKLTVLYTIVLCMFLHLILLIDFQIACKNFSIMLLHFLQQLHTQAI